MPKTRLGKWAGGLLAVFLVLLAALLLGVKLSGLTPGTPQAIVLGTSMMFAGTATFVTAVISLIKFKDHSIVVIAATVIGSIATLFIIVEIGEIAGGSCARLIEGEAKSHSVRGRHG
jgi:hypothetical protein